MESAPGFLTALASLAFVSSITPGPNNIMLMQSGVRFGLRRTLGHLAGVSIGFCVLLAAGALGLGALIARWPTLQNVAAVLCAIYLLWLAAKMLNPIAAGVPDAGAAAARPMRFGEAVLFQWINPKAWSMAVAGATLIARVELPGAARIAMLVIVFGAVNLPCILAWAALGAQLRRHLSRPSVQIAFGLAMASLLIVCAAWMVKPLFAGSHGPAVVGGLPALALGR